MAGGLLMVTTDTEYSPGGLDSLLSRWQEILTLAAEGPGPRPRGEGSGQDPAYADPFHFIHLVADVERAWANLPGPPWTLQRGVIHMRMSGHCLSVIAREMRCRWELVATADEEARCWMAGYLGGSNR